MSDQPKNNFFHFNLRLSCKPTEALKFYNKCRGDKNYGKMASIEMANICLNPDNEIRSDEDWKKKSIKYLNKKLFNLSLTFNINPINYNTKFKHQD